MTTHAQVRDDYERRCFGSSRTERNSRSARVRSLRFASDEEEDDEEEDARTKTILYKFDELVKTRIMMNDEEIETEPMDVLLRKDLEGEPIENVQPSPQTSKVTSVAELIAFTLPTMAIWLCDPILSLLDTAMVGLTSTIARSSIFAF